MLVVVVCLVVGAFLFLSFRKTVRVPVYEADNIVLVDPIGGSGKTTRADFLENAFPEYNRVYNDKYKYGPCWVRRSNAEYKQAVMKQLTPPFIFDTTYFDNKMSAQKECVNAAINSADLVIWEDLPMLVTFWRKAFRSLKRAFGYEQGVATETWKNVYEMLKKVVTEYSYRKKHLEVLFEDNADDHRFIRVQWPNTIDLAVS